MFYHLFDVFDHLSSVLFAPFCCSAMSDDDNNNNNNSSFPFAGEEAVNLFCPACQEVKK